MVREQLINALVILGGFTGLWMTRNHPVGTPSMFLLITLLGLINSVLIVAESHRPSQSPMTVHEPGRAGHSDIATTDPNQETRP